MCGASVPADGKNNKIDVFLIPMASPISVDAFPGSIRMGIPSFSAITGACDSIVGGYMSLAITSKEGIEESSSGFADSNARKH